jgi:ferredoxin-NADP reductase
MSLLAALWVTALTADGARVAFRRYRMRRQAAARRSPLRLLVSDRNDVTSDLFSVTLSRPSGRRLPAFIPGQYLTLIFEPEPGAPAIRRRYSIAAWQKRPRTYELGIKREGEGRGSRWLHAHLRPGTEIHTLPPQGEFVLSWPVDAREITLVAGGIGITPLRAMVHRALERQTTPPVRVTLVHAAKSAHELTYREEFREIARRHSWFHYVPILSQPEEDWTGLRGRLDASRLLQVVTRPDETPFYFCASVGMMDALMAGLRQLGVAEGRFHFESFGAASLNTDERAYAVSVSGSPSFEFQGQPSLLHALEEQGVALPAECRAGQCGLCRLRMTNGLVRWLVPAACAVTKDEILACCCVPQSDLVLTRF